MGYAASPVQIASGQVLDLEEALARQVRVTFLVVASRHPGICMQVREIATLCFDALHRLRPAKEPAHWVGPAAQSSRLPISTSSRHVLGALLALLLFPPASVAEVYKWVDANGQTQYGDRKAAAGNAKTLEIKAPPAPEVPQSVAPYSWSSGAGHNFSPPTPKAGPPYGPQFDKRPRQLSDGKDHGTDESRCALARDVLGGRLMHGNGNRVDKHGREVAQNDIKMFCR